jgi:hypothetical protein
VCGLLALPAVAAAQEQIWLRDRRYTEGPGYRVGDFEIHPGAAAEFGYDSNYLHRASSEGPAGSLRLRLTPSVSLSTLTQQRKEEGGGTAPPPAIEFKGAASLTYNEFFPVGAGTAADALRAQRDLGAMLDLGLVILPRRSWSGQLNLGYMRALTPTDQGVVGTDKLAFTRDLPRGSAELIWTPGAGLFEWRIGYSFAGTIFESSQFSQLTNIQNSITTRGRWRFLPRTALMYDASFGFVTYMGAAPDAQGGKLPSHPMRARLGINGLITPNFSILAMAGWGASFYSASSNSAVPREDFDSVIGQLELKWFLTPNPGVEAGATTTPTLSSVSVGFTRDFFDSYIGNYFERDRGYLSFSFFYAGKFLIVADGGAGPVLYPKARVGNVEVAPFTDIRIDAGLLAEYRFKDWFGVNASVRYNENINKSHIPISGGSDDLSFRDIEAYLGLRWLM